MHYDYIIHHRRKGRVKTDIYWPTGQVDFIIFSCSVHDKIFGTMYLRIMKYLPDGAFNEEAGVLFRVICDCLKSFCDYGSL